MRWIAAFFLGLFLLGVLAFGALFGVRTARQQDVAVQVRAEADRAREEMQRLQSEIREVASAELGNAGFPQPVHAQMAYTHSGPPPTFMRISFFGLIFLVLIAGGLLLALLIAAVGRSRSAPAGAMMDRQQETLTIQRILDKLDSMERRTAALEAQFGERLRSQPAHTWNER